ncbi:MAG: LysM peptidoglycan-binding domain-containing protein [Ferruginibacter sp.]|nr:LysM peptidoglycan-binding domain-containing protein [Cytophagales bacterium]
MTEPEKKKSRAGNRSRQEINFPLLLLGGLLAIVVSLIYVGYDYLSDDATGTPLAANHASLPEPDEDAEPEASVAEATLTSAKGSAGKRNETGDKPKPTPKAKKPAPAELELPEATEPEETRAAGASTRSVSVSENTASRNILTHRVRAGETFSAIARRYHLSKSVLKSLNPHIRNEADVKAGVTRLRIKIRAIHTVGPGDVLSRVAAKYGVDKELIMAANGKTRDYAKRGEKLIIPVE